VLPPPGPPLTVGLDGGFIHAKDQKSHGEGWFEVIAGKSMPEERRCDFLCRLSIISYNAERFRPFKLDVTQYTVQYELLRKSAVAGGSRNPLLTTTFCAKTSKANQRC
jgi:hypothetical protein